MPRPLPRPSSRRAPGGRVRRSGHSQFAGRRRFRRAFRSPGREGGFTLLEIVVAMMIFSLIIAFSFWTMSQSVDQSLDAERARELRLLAARKLAELAVFEKHYDEVLDGDFADLPDGMREKFEGWTWKLDVTDRTVFGTQKDEHAEPLFDSETDTSLTSKTGSSSTSGDESSSASKGETQVLRELVLTVTAPGDDGGPGDSVEIVTYLPQVVTKQPQQPAGGGK